MRGREIQAVGGCARIGVTAPKHEHPPGLRADTVRGFLIPLSAGGR
jgi:hypothetical protein